MPAQSMYVQGSSCTYSGDLDPMHVSPAFQAEENVVCNFNCMTTQLVHSRHSVSRRAATDAGVYLQGLSSHFSFAVNPILVVSEMPGAPTRSTADNMTAARQRVGPPSILGANPNSYFLRDIPSENRMDLFNGFINLYMNGRFFRQRDVAKDFWTEDPTALTELLVTDCQWYEQHFRGASKRLTALLRHNNTLEFQKIRRNRTQGDIALIDFLLTEAMQRNFPKLCPASLWALAHCMNKQRFTFGTAIGTDNLRCHPSFKNRSRSTCVLRRGLIPRSMRWSPLHPVPATPLSSQGRFQKENLRILSTSHHAPMQGLAASAMVLILAMPRASSDKDLMSTMESAQDLQGAT